MNAPASRSEVTVPQMAREAGEGARRPSRFREARNAALGSLASDFAGPGSRRFCAARSCPVCGAEEAAGAGGEALRFAGRAARFCQAASRSAPPAPSSPGPLPGLAVGLSLRPAVKWKRTWGTPAPLSFVMSRLRGLLSPPPPNPKGVVQEAAWVGVGPQKLIFSSAPFLGLRPLQTRGGIQPFAQAAAKIWGRGDAFLAPPSQSSRLLREEIPTWERRGCWKEIRAGGRLLQA